MTSDTSEAFAVPAKRAAAIAKISMRQLDYWAETRLVEPSIRRRLSERNHVRLYTFRDMLELLVVAQLVNRGVTLQHVRRVVAQLRDRGYDAPLRELHYATAGDELYFRLPDGSWEGGRRPRQQVIEQVIKLAPLTQRIKTGARKRPPSDVGRVERRRGSLGSKPVFAGTRIPVMTVQRFLARGANPKEVLEAFPDLYLADIEVARTTHTSPDAPCASF